MLIYCLEPPQKKIKKIYKNKLKFINIKNPQKIPKSVEYLYCKLKYYIDSKIVNQNSRIKYLISPTTGLNHIDHTFINKKKIKIINLKPTDKKIKSITSTGEYTLALILNSARRIFSFLSLKSTISNRYLFNTYQFRNYTVGIIGLGRIGSYLNKKLQLLGFKTLTYDHSIDNKNILKKLLKKSDIISLNINAHNNLNFIDKKKLNFMKKGVVLINTARGEIINEIDLVKYLRKNTQSLAVLDVIKNEQKLIKNNLLFRYQKKYKNLIILPHLGGSTIDAMETADNYVLNKFIKNNEKKN